MAYATINDPSAHFQVKKYTGNGSSNHAITFDGNSNMRPDWLWNKVTSEADSHATFDSSRGLTKILYPNLNLAEGTDSNGNIESLDSNGFTVGGNQQYANRNGATQITWAWKGNGGTTSTDSNGTQTSTVQVNAAAGFSITTFAATNSAGQTVGHGLGAAPDMYLWKSRARADLWYVYHRSIGPSKYLRLNDINTASTNTNVWSNTDPSSTLIYYGGNSLVGSSSENTIIYSFKSIQGYSKFGKYKGNGDADGTFVYLGFKPAWLLIKGSDVAGYWVMIDNKRDLPNGTGGRLGAQATDAEYGNANVDLLSNGFKIRASGSDSDTNQDGNVYTYAAFASEPLVGTNNVFSLAQ